MTAGTTANGFASSKRSISDGTPGPPGNAGGTGNPASAATGQSADLPTLADIRTTRAAVLVEQRQPLELADITLPTTLEPGQVLVHVHYSGLCGSQVGEIDGVKGPDRFLPHLLGHEGGAEVCEIGPAVKHVKRGDAVVMHWRKGPGIDAATPTYTWKDKPLNAGWITTFNEFAVVSENRLTAIDRDFPLDQAALFGCPVTTGLGAITRDAELTLGESIVVFGAGGVGLSVIQGAAMLNAHPVIAIDLQDDKLALARKLGATHTINASALKPTEVSDQVRSILRDARGHSCQGADVVIENTGHIPVIEQGYDLAGPKGRTVLIGVPAGGKQPSLPTLPLHFGKVLTGSHGGQTQPEVDIPRYAALANAGKLDLGSMITHRFAFDQMNEAIDQLRSGQITGRGIVSVSE